jgi:putative hydrolase of the HAD superfamily
LTTLAVTLDAAGTLFQPREPVADTYVSLASSFDAALNPSALGAAFARHFPEMPPMAFPRADADTLDRLERGWWRLLVKKVTSDCGGIADFDGYFDALYAYYSRGSAWSLYPEVVEVLHGLRARGLRTAVVSNFDSRLIAILAELGIADLFDAVIYSTAAGVAKPDARIFEMALEALGTASSSTVHLGDTKAADYFGSTNAEMRGLLIARDHRVPTDVPSSNVIARLDGVFAHI